MNTVFLIGNGFDINLGLKTRYTDFYKYYNSKESKNESIKLLKNNISNNFNNWSDLEQALGQYTENFTTSDEFISVFEDLGDNLGDYLIALEKDFCTILFDKDKVAEYLCNPERYLSTADRLEMANCSLTRISP
jgi:hypothetical protein